MAVMNALLEQSVDEARQIDTAVGGRATAWSVLPLRSRETGRSQPRFGIGDNDNSDVLEPALPPPAGWGTLKLLGEWHAPENESSSAVMEPKTSVPGEIVAHPTDASDATPDGDLVALGSLACMLSIILTMSGLVGLSGLLF